MLPANTTKKQIGGSHVKKSTSKIRICKSSPESTLMEKKEIEETEVKWDPPFQPIDAKVFFHA